jgi:hypothetical protein
MKKLTAIFFILITALLINGCGKKDTAGTDSGKKETGKTEDVKTAKDVSMDDNSSYHVTYKMDKEGKGMTMDMYRKGVKVRTDVNTSEKEMNMKATGYFSNKTIYMVMDMAGKKMGMKMDAKDAAKDDKDIEKQIYDVKDRLKDFDKAGTGDVLGYTCNKYTDKKGNTYYIYKDQATLKMEFKGGTMEATKFEPDVKLEDSFFEVPKDVEFMDMGNLNLDKLKDLKKVK